MEFPCFFKKTFYFHHKEVYKNIFWQDRGWTGYKEPSLVWGGTTSSWSYWWTP